jgi:hypothetical protein
VGGPTLVRGAWQLRAIDELGFLIVPLLFGQGSRSPTRPSSNGSSWSNSTRIPTARSRCATRPRRTLASEMPHDGHARHSPRPARRACVTSPANRRA